MASHAGLASPAPIAYWPRTMGTQIVEPRSGRFRLPIPRLARFRWRLWPQRNKRPPERILARYTAPTLIHRHRLKLLAVLAVTAFVYGFFFGIGGTYVLVPLGVPLAIMLGIIIWLLPDTDRAPIGQLPWLMTAFIIAMSCWPNYLALALPGLPWITANRLIEFPLAAMVLISWSVSPSFRAEMRRVLAASPVVSRLMGALVLIATLSIALSIRPAESLSRFFAAQLDWTLIFLVAAFVFRVEGRARRLNGMMLGTLVFISVIGLWEARLGHAPWAGHVPSFLSVDAETVQKMSSGTVRKATGLYRVKSVFSSPLGHAEYVALTIPFIIHLIVYGRQRWLRVAAILALPLIADVLIRTDSRLGNLGFLVAFLLYPAGWALLHLKRASRPIALAIIGIYPVVFSLFIVATFAIHRLRVKIWGGGAQQASTEGRKQQIAMGIPKVLKRPWGYGIGEDGRALGFTNMAGVPTIDTYYLSIALELGIIGFIVYYAIFGYTVWRSGRNLFDARDPDTLTLLPIAIALINFVLVKSVFSLETNHPLVFAMLGASVGLAYRLQQEKRASVTSAIAQSAKPMTTARRWA